MNGAVVVVLAIAIFIHGFKGFCKIKPLGSRAFLQINVPSLLTSEDSHLGLGDQGDAQQQLV